MACSGSEPLIKLQMNRFCVFTIHLGWKLRFEPEFPSACSDTCKNLGHSGVFPSKCCFPGSCSLAQLIGRLKKKKTKTHKKNTKFSPRTPNCKYPPAIVLRNPGRTPATGHSTQPGCDVRTEQNERMLHVLLRVLRGHIARACARAHRCAPAVHVRAQARRRKHRGGG